LAFDITSLNQNYANTLEGIWLKNNCYKYGFIIRYPENKEAITGYMYEPWHIRYVGIDLATKIYNSGKTLEEYLEIN
ncbi:MAG: M15 family metallopeptidase, partial [Bacilli bacterium]